MGLEMFKVWQHAGLTCMLRHSIREAPCGYVVVPERHPLHGVCDPRRLAVLQVHGGVTWADHIEMAGWCIGFDMAHACDFDLDRRTPLHTDEECVRETNHLADQLAAMMDGV